MSGRCARKWTARLVAMVVLPTPPLLLLTVTTRTRPRPIESPAEMAAGQIAQTDHAAGLCPAKGLHAGSGPTTTHHDGPVCGNPKGIAVKRATRQIADADHAAGLCPAKGLHAGSGPTATGDHRAIVGKSIGITASASRQKSKIDLSGRLAPIEGLVADLYRPEVDIAADNDLAIGRNGVGQCAVGGNADHAGCFGP